MNKKVYQILSVMVVFALTFGSFTSASATPQMAATTYYVSTTGNDANAGTSTAPYRTIQKCANVASSGSTCSVAAGTYNERVSVTSAGITFTTSSGLPAVIKGFSISSNGDNTIVQNFVSENNDSNSGAFDVFEGATGVEIRDTVSKNSCMAGIILRGNSNLAEGNEIFKSRQCGGSGPDADGIRVFGDGNVIRGNYVHDISLAENPTAHIDCIQNWGTLLNTIIEGNTCNVVHAGIQTDVGNVHNIIIRNNVFVASRPLNMRGEGLKITNNVFVGNAASAYVLLQSSSNVTFQNNIIYNTSDGFLTSVGSVIAGGHNIFYNSSGKAPRRDSGYNYVNGQLKWPTDKWQVNPIFVNPDAGDYHLKTGSPGIDTGVGGADIGAFAFGGTLAATATVMGTATPSVVTTATITTASDTSTVSPQVSITSTESSVPSSPTSTISVPASATPTASPVPALPTSTSVPPTATAQPQNPPASEKKYDDKDSGFVYSSDWRDVSQSQASGGSFKKTTEIGSSVTFTFTGQSLSVLYTSGPAFGKINVYIDGVLVGTITETGTTNVYQKRWDYPGQLTSGNHTLKLVTAGSTNTNGSIDAVIVYSTVSTAPTSMPVLPTLTASSVPASPMPTATRVPASATPTASAVPVLPTSTSVQPVATVQQQSQPTSETKYDDKHGSFVYSSDWKDVSRSQASGGSFKKTTEIGSSVTFTFTGKSFSVLYTSGPAFGKLDVYIDGVLVGNISENGKTTVYQNRWDYPGQLTLGNHTLKLVAAGSTNTNGSIDAVIVR